MWVSDLVSHVKKLDGCSNFAEDWDHAHAVNQLDGFFRKLHGIIIRALEILFCWRKIENGGWVEVWIWWGILLESEPPVVVLQSIHFCGCWDGSAFYCSCAHCGRPLHPIPDQPAGQTHCNSGVSKHPPKPPIPSKTLFFSQLFISKLKVLVSSSGIRILKERREEKQKIKFLKTERDDAWCASEQSLNPSTNLLGDLFCVAEKSQSTCFADDPSPSLVSVLCPELHHPSSSLEYYPWLWCLCLHGHFCYLASLLVHWNHQGTLDKFSKTVRKKIAWRTLSLVSMDAKLKVKQTLRSIVCLLTAVSLLSLCTGFATESWVG